MTAKWIDYLLLFVGSYSIWDCSEHPLSAEFFMSHNTGSLSIVVQKIVVVEIHPCRRER